MSIKFNTDVRINVKPKYNFYLDEIEAENLIGIIEDNLEWNRKELVSFIKEIVDKPVDNHRIFSEVQKRVHYMDRIDTLWRKVKELHDKNERQYEKEEKDND